MLAYIYIDTLAPQNIGWRFVSAIPVSLIAFCAAFGGWLLADSKEGARFGLRQVLLTVLLAWCFVTTMNADFPVEAAQKWAWVWKALVFAIFVPLTLTTRLRIEAAILTMVLTAGAIVIGGGIKTAIGGGGYGTLYLFVQQQHRDVRKLDHRDCRYRDHPADPVGDEARHGVSARLAGEAGSATR